MLTKSKYLALYRRQQESGLSVKEFCLNEGIGPATFYYWKKKLKASKTGNPGFIPLVVKPTSTFSDQNYANNPSSIPPCEPDALLELVYPNGTRLRIKQDLDMAQLRSLICLFD